MSKEEVKELIKALEQSGFDPVSYSGRGMYGKYCVSVQDISAWEVARALPDDLDVPEPSEDDLGLGNVLYWPRYLCPESEDEEGVDA